MAVVIDTRTVEPSERFDFWIEGAHAVFFPLRFRRAPEDLRPFGGLVRQYLLGPLALTQVVTQPTTISRTRTEISSFDPRSIQLCFLRRGSMVGSQGGRDTTLSPGDIFIHDISAPSVLRSRQDTELLVLEAPKALLGREAVWAAENAGRTVSPAFSRALLAPVIRNLTDGLVAGDVTEDDAAVGEGVLDLMRAACRDRVGVDAAPASARMVGLKRYIDEHIGDPSLSPATIAAANFMSLRTLQNLFRAEGLTVRGWIRERRLAGARRDLRDPRFADASVSQIAHAWGLPNPGHFSRLFRAAYGVSPRDSRG